MGWLSEQKAVDDSKATIVVPAFGNTQNDAGMLYPDSAYGNYATQAFGRNELVYASIMFKARTLPQGVMRVYSPDRVEPLEEHRLRRLLAKPNPTTDETAFMMLSLVYLDLSGNSFWLIIRGRDDRPAELWPIRPDLVRIVPNPRNPRQWRYGYMLDPTTNAAGRSPEVIPIAFRDMIHIKYPNPLDAYFGQAPLRPATRAVSLDNARTDFVDTLLRNDAVPRVVVTTASAVDEEITNRLERRWMRKFGGTNRGRPAFLQTGMEVKTLGLNLENLQFGDLSGVTESRITMAFGVHPILIGAKVGLDRSTFSNYREAKSAFWEDEGMNLQALFSGGVRSQLVPEFTGVGRSPIDVRYDNSQVLALQEDESKRWERATTALARGAITINEHHRIVGLDPVPGGDVFLIGAGVTPRPAHDLVSDPATTEPVEPVELEAASYAHRFLAALPSVNGHKADPEVSNAVPAR